VRPLIRDPRWLRNKGKDIDLVTRFGGNGVVVFYGLAKPIRTPLIGPPRQPQP
jgi:hypothetical protein